MTQELKLNIEDNIIDKESKVSRNKKYLKKLITSNLMHESGLKLIEIAKQNGSWTLLDEVENLVTPEDLQKAFNKNPLAFENYQRFSRTYKKGYLSWLVTVESH